MYSPNEPVIPYLRKIVTTPEGIVLVILSAIYLAGAVFFDAVVNVMNRFGAEMSDSYRNAFMFMPFLLLVVYLRMDISARTTTGRILTVSVLLLIAIAPMLRAFNIF